MSSSLSPMDKGTEWMKTASEKELREFVKVLDANEGHPRHKELVAAFNRECNRRAAKYFEEKDGGEWI